MNNSVTYRQVNPFRSLIVFLVIIGFPGCSANNNDKKEKPHVDASQSWTGTWVRTQFQNSGNFDVINVSKDSIQFELHVSGGGHESSIDGFAIATDSTTAIFLAKAANDLCRIEFKLIGDTVVVIKETGNNCFSAPGVTYSGEYKNEVLSRANDPEENKTLFDLEIFKTKEQDSIFRSLVGDKYSLFVSSTQLTAEDYDMDSLNAMVRSSAVRGLYTLMENIIMINASNNMIWAAVIDDQQRVLYFTNNKEYKNKLPNTIENWRQNFKQYPVIYNK